LAFFEAVTVMCGALIATLKCLQLFSVQGRLQRGSGGQLPVLFYDHQGEGRMFVNSCFSSFIKI